MPHAPGRFNNTSDAEQYYAPDPQTWSGQSSSSSSSSSHYRSADPPQSTGGQPQFSGYSNQPAGHPAQFANQNRNYGIPQRAANQQLQFQMMQGAGHMPPPPFPPPHVGRAPTQIDNRPPDYWHSNNGLMCVNRGVKLQFPHSISFRPTTGPCTFGVALLNLEYARGMIAPTETLDLCMPPSIMKYANAAFLIDWPGYRQESYVLTLINPRKGRHVTRADLGAQVTQIFKDFANSRKQSDFTDGDGAMLLGVNGVLYDQVRLTELYTKDGMSFRAQWGLNAHFLAV
ncbi:hypothetical protein C8F04DRAFT_1395501 [Mycena alexandri]|uniref:Uncharacterized protein n=1 Tax=Mycena alexandri TaxID=1745969 RepID=A0AAD6SV94_9AGAR|nr:hypothetical protein C8F04DRAFT_1395501 [Mycena alexandri]